MASARLLQSMPRGWAKLSGATSAAPSFGLFDKAVTSEDGVSSGEFSLPLLEPREKTLQGLVKRYAESQITVAHEDHCAGPLRRVHLSALARRCQ